MIKIHNSHFQIQLKTNKQVVDKKERMNRINIKNQHFIKKRRN